MSPTNCGVSLCVWSRDLVNEEAMAHWWGAGGGGVTPKKKIRTNIYYTYIKNTRFAKVNMEIQA